MKEVNEGYLYHVMRRFAPQRLIVRISARGYTLAELVEGRARAKKAPWSRPKTVTKWSP